MNELSVYCAEGAIVKSAGRNYEVHCPSGAIVKMERKLDFDVIPGTKKPSLLKSGAEKVAMGYGLLQHYTIESKIEQPSAEPPFFFYTVKCELVKIGTNGTEYVFTSGYGSANTSEKRNGRNSPFDAANSSLKMAQKRALVSAAISISGLSNMFSQDMENEDYTESNANDMKSAFNPESPISKKQITRLYASGGNYGLTAPEVKDIITSFGFVSTKDILQKDFDRVCEAIRAKGESL